MEQPAEQLRASHEAFSIGGRIPCAAGGEVTAARGAAGGDRAWEEYFCVAAQPREPPPRSSKSGR